MSVDWTPGPWAWSPDFSFGKDHIGNLFGVGGMKVFESASYEGMWFASYHGQTDAANAHLIAAAPELYQALSEAICLVPTSQATALKRFAAVLARARGEHSLTQSDPLKGLGE